MPERVIKGFDKRGSHLTGRGNNLDWMKSTYSTTEYWSDDLRYGYRWKKEGAVKDYRHTSEAFDRLLRPIMPPHQIETALEIGPGGGRWTTELLRVARNLKLVDLSAPAIEICRERFKYYDNIEYFVGDGSHLPLPDKSVDLVFSWGVFVHIEKTIIADYLVEIARVLKPNGRAVIQHGVLGENVPQSRTNFKQADLYAAASQARLTIAAQIMTSKGFFPEYFDGKKAVYLDSVTAFEPDAFLKEA
jgi:SAM-dependent methyltransferase